MTSMTLTRRDALVIGAAGALAGTAGPVALAEAALPETRAPFAVKTFTTTAAGIHRNIFSVETGDGFVVVDAPFRKSDGAAVRAWLAEFDKPILGVLITHMYPDHNFGLTEMLRGSDAPIVATPAVADAIQEAENMLQSIVPSVIGADETERDRRFPDVLVESGSTVALGGMTFRVEDVGIAESAADALWSVEGYPAALFIGDLVYHGMHTWVAEGATGRFIDVVERLRDTVAPGTLLMPGHGALVTPDAIAGQVAFLRAYRAAIQDLAEGRPALFEAQKDALVERMMAYRPSPALAFAIRSGADPVAAELAGGEAAR